MKGCFDEIRKYRNTGETRQNLHKRPYFDANRRGGTIPPQQRKRAANRGKTAKTGGIASAGVLGVKYYLTTEAAPTVSKLENVAIVDVLHARTLRVAKIAKLDGYARAR